MKVSVLLNLSDHERVLLGKVAGDIVLSDNPGSAMRRWREFFNISQKDLSEKIGVSPSVISDYEGGRRENPGVHFVKRFVKALFEIDRERGGDTIHGLAKLVTPSNAAILDVRDLPIPISLKRFVRAVSGEILSSNSSLGKVSGYVVVDAARALEDFSGFGVLKLLEIISDRAVIFVNVLRDATPMVSFKFSLLKPRVVVYHGFSPTEFDVKLAEGECVTLIHSKARSVDHLMRSLMRLCRSVQSKVGKVKNPNDG